MRYTHRLSRRTLLRGAAAGVPLALGLPALESMLDGNGEAYADGTPILRRMGVWFFGAGGHWEWTPPATGPLVLPVGLTPLERHKRNVLLISNLDWESFGDFATNRHFMGAASVLTGTPWKSNGPQGPSLDQVVAPYLNKGRRASLELSLTDTNVISWSGVASPNPPMNDPNKVFASLFGDSTGSTRSLRALYLDAIKSDGRLLAHEAGGRGSNPARRVSGRHQ